MPASSDRAISVETMVFMALSIRERSGQHNCRASSLSLVCTGVNHRAVPQDTGASVIEAGSVLLPRLGHPASIAWRSKRTISSEAPQECARHPRDRIQGWHCSMMRWRSCVTCPRTCRPTPPAPSLSARRPTRTTRRTRDALVWRRTSTAGTSSRKRSTHPRFGLPTLYTLPVGVP